MSVSDGQNADQTVLNAAFLSRTSNTSTSGQLDLDNADAVSGSTIANLQKELNGVASFTGRTLNGAKDEVPLWSSNSIGVITDNTKARVDAIQAEVESLGAADPANDVGTLFNLGIQTSVAASALTIALKIADGSTDPSGGSPVKISFRSSTATSGSYNIRSVTSALSLVVASGDTLGHGDAVAAPIYVYGIEFSGATEIAVSSIRQDEKSLSTTTAIASGASASGFYSTTARSNVPIRLFAIINSTQTTAGVWDAAPTDVSLASAFVDDRPYTYSEIERTSDFLQASPTASTVYIPSTSYSISVNPGVYTPRLYGVLYADLTSGNTVLMEMALGTSTTPGSGLLSDWQPVHISTFNGTDELDVSSVVFEDITVTTHSTIYINVRWFNWSGGPSVNTFGILANASYPSKFILTKKD